MIIEGATVRDAQEILDLQKLAYRSEAEIYHDYTIPPLVQTLEEMKADFGKYVFLKASVDGRIVGSVKARMRRRTCYIGRLIVHPDYQSRGIGSDLMSEMEAYFSQAKRFELFTGNNSERNISLYRRLGYKEDRLERVSDNLTLLHMEKRVDLESIPGVGPSIAQDLRDLGFNSVQDLRDQDPERMYRHLCQIRGARQDPCVLYVFRCAVYYASNEEHVPELLKWWNWKDREKTSR